MPNGAATRDGFVATYNSSFRRGAREAEGAPLLREYAVKSCIEGSNPSLSARYKKAPRKRGFFVLAARSRAPQSALRAHHGLPARKARESGAFSFGRPVAQRVDARR